MPSIAQYMKGTSKYIRPCSPSSKQPSGENLNFLTLPAHQNLFTLSEAPLGECKQIGHHQGLRVGVLLDLDDDDMFATASWTVDTNQHVQISHLGHLRWLSHWNASEQSPTKIKFWCRWKEDVPIVQLFGHMKTIADRWDSLLQAH